MSASSIEFNRETIRTLTVGDKVRVTFAPLSSTSPDSVRTVTVSAPPVNGSLTTGVSSGKVRPGRNPGGAILEIGGELFFCPTMNQPMRRLRSVTRI